MTGGDDDIARALPRAPSPAPARREAAIAEAMRRFDGGGEQSAQERRPAAGPTPWRSPFNRPQAGALAGAFLVALIALPLAWTSLPDRARDGGRDRPAEARDGTPRPAPAATEPALLPPGVPAPPSPAADAAPGAELPPAPAARAGGSSSGPGKAAPAAADAPAADAAPGESEPAFAGGGMSGENADVVVTGSRIRRPNLESSVPITSVGGEEFFQTGKSAGRGDWNACTVDDPERDLSACRRDVASVARGASGRASPHLAEGLERAWEDEPEKAVGAFDRAIALAPRSSAAYLNRGLARRALGDLDGALADLDRAIAYAPQSARGYYHRSLLLRQRGDSRRARADEARAIELDPRYAAAVRAARRQAR